MRCPVCREEGLETVAKAVGEDWRSERLRCVWCGTRMTAEALLTAKQHEIEERAERVGRPA